MVDSILSGLMAPWFDACPGFAISVDREGAFDFTDPYLYTDSSFTVAPSNPSGFDPDTSDFSQFNFGQYFIVGIYLHKTLITVTLITYTIFYQ